MNGKKFNFNTWETPFKSAGIKSKQDVSNLVVSLTIFCYVFVFFISYLIPEYTLYTASISIFTSMTKFYLCYWKKKVTPQFKFCVM